MNSVNLRIAFPVAVNGSEILLYRNRDLNSCRKRSETRLEHASNVILFVLVKNVSKLHSPRSFWPWFYPFIFFCLDFWKYVSRYLEFVVYLLKIWMHLGISVLDLHGFDRNKIYTSVSWGVSSSGACFTMEVGNYDFPSKYFFFLQNQKSSSRISHNYSSFPFICPCLFAIIHSLYGVISALSLYSSFVVALSYSYIEIAII